MNLFTQHHKAILRSLFFMLYSFTVLSCDTVQHVQGTVIDSETGLPLDKVLITKDNIKDRFIYTDSLGYFNITSMTGFIFVPPKILLSFEKEGYYTTTKKFKSFSTDSTSIVLKKQTE